MENLLNIPVIDDPQKSEFEELYIQIRRKENRIYTNKEVSLLPSMLKNHLYYSEWKLRRKSCDRLLHYLRSKKKSLKILEVGCGNGWLSAKIASIKDSDVTGIDINRLELEQAIEVFGYTKNLSFLYETIYSLPIISQFDIIVFAASIQYVASIKNIIQYAQSILNENGEIHIIDSPFYKINKIAEAKSRSDSYFRQLGFEQAKRYYHHHSIDHIKNFNYKILYKPFIILGKTVPGINPFYWICIKK